MGPVSGFLGTRASLLVDVELLLGLACMLWLAVGAGLAWRGRRAAHAAAMQGFLGLAGLFLAVFILNAALGGGVEAVGAAGRQPSFLGLLALHVALSLIGSVIGLRLVADGIRGNRQDAQAARFLARHRRWAGFVLGFWLVNGLLGVLIYWTAYML
jgi:uncharacterized membrane protein YozB (DUF420 family)